MWTGRCGETLMVLTRKDASIQMFEYVHIIPLSYSCTCVWKSLHAPRPSPLVRSGVYTCPIVVGRSFSVLKPAFSSRRTQPGTYLVPSFGVFQQRRRLHIAHPEQPRTYSPVSGLGLREGEARHSAAAARACISPQRVVDVFSTCATLVGGAGGQKAGSDRNKS